MSEQVAHATAFVYVDELRGQGRPRHTATGQTYKNRKDRLYEAEVRRQFMEQVGEKFRYFAGEVRVLIEFTRPLPKSAPKKRNGEADTYKPDLDNMVKSVFDALNGVAWRDDAQITELTARKHPRLRMAATAILIDITYWSNLDYWKEEFNEL